MKNKILVISISIALVFYAGYRLGLTTSNRWTIDYMLDQEVFYIAARLAFSVDVLEDIYKNNPEIDRITACKIKKLIVRGEEDWRKCKLNKFCNEKISDGYYSAVDAKMAMLSAVNCD